ncbi:MAG TPA: S8 family serine peptidase [Candidatus Manganitrophaceae bacterium]|nr:S8 family serine peptidase [Candidatus Manganitrophaceae bacterium]
MARFFDGRPRRALKAAGIVLFLLLSSPALGFPATTKIDPVLALMAKRGPSGLEKNRGTLKPSPGAARVKTIVRFEGSLSGVEALGGKVRSVLGEIATVDLPVDAIGPVSALPNIVYLEAAKKVKPQIDASVPETGATAIRSGAPPQWRGDTGRNVIIGIVDTGLDLAHADFKDPEGKSRVLFLWDQTAAGSPPPGFSYGNECSGTVIDAGGCPESDTHGHGTHVAGIAAGNGAGTGNGQPAFRYVGMAPEADLIVVRTDYTNDDILDGIAYIQAKAAALGRPSVINLSLGSDTGSHDGTQNYERALDRASGPGRVIVASAGNAAAAGLHASGTVAPTGTPVGFTVPAGTTEVIFDLWYAGTDRFNVSVDNGLGCAAPGAVAPGNIASFSLPCGLIDIYSSDRLEAVNNDREIYIDLRNGASPISAGTWTVTLSGASSGTGRFDAWLYTDSQAGAFTTNVDPSMTLNSSASSAETISVAAYVTKNSWISLAGPEDNTLTRWDIAPFSSRGPRRPCGDPAKCPAVQKPEIAAPGTAIFSSLSTAMPSPDPALVDPDGVHIAFGGTSMAAPHVTGAVALLLQGAPALTPGEIKSILAGNSKVDDFTTHSIPNDLWGFGKLNVQAAFAATPNPPPAAPAAFSAVVQSGAVALSWTANGELDLDGYNLYRSAGSGPAIPVVFIPRQAAAFTDREVINGQTYFYTLRAVDTKGQESEGTAKASASPRVSLAGGDAGGGGCVMGRSGGIDPMLGALLGLALAALVRRRLRRSGSPPPSK